MNSGRFFVALLSFAFNIATITADNSTVTYDWRVTYVSTACDGVTMTEYGINNDVSTRALIELELGQTVQVSVTNELDEMTCLHWHGLQQLGTQEMDGASDITQCGIAPGGSAVYTFTPERAGTYWWHSHHSTQYAYGLRGPLIVHASADEKQSWEQEIAAEYTLQLADLYHALPGIVPMWDSVIINSLGRYNCTAAASHGYLECNSDQPLARFKFEAGKKYRLRLINMGALAPFEFSIDGHEFSVVAADGEYLQPSEEITTLRINAGQRYDIVVEAKATSSSAIGSFWIRATALYGLPWTAGTAAVAQVFGDLALVMLKVWPLCTTRMMTRRIRRRPTGRRRRPSRSTTSLPSRSQYFRLYRPTVRSSSSTSVVVSDTSPSTVGTTSTSQPLKNHLSSLSQGV
ncbi:hypothetical protein DVH05_009574 [Phytophthora capsici]|nr:hypothetical protein DVH05_009574 [Phytophthora capsici]